MENYEVCMILKPFYYLAWWSNDDKQNNKLENYEVCASLNVFITWNGG